MAKAVNNLHTQWVNKSLADFEARFGKPSTAETATEGAKKSKWQATSRYFVAAHIEYKATPYVSYTVGVPDSWHTATCVIAVTSIGGKITALKVLTDSGMHQLGKSFCQETFGR